MVWILVAAGAVLVIFALWVTLRDRQASRPSALPGSMVGVQQPATETKLPEAGRDDRGQGGHKCGCC